MRLKSLAVSLLVAATAASPATGQEQDEYRHGRLRHVEGGTTLQRATEAGSEEAMRNLPFLPGDRVWTDDQGRAEFQFGSGLVRVDSRSKVDYLDHDERRGDRVILRLWSGAVFLVVRDDRGAPDFELETPAGLVSARGRVALRVDVAYGEAQVSVFEGEAQVDNGRRSEKLDAGERTWLRPGSEPDKPTAFDRREADDFTRWCFARDEQDVRAQNAPRDLPEEILPYAPELQQNGSWHVEVGIGSVWRPYVGPGWQPYLDGRWAWSAYGWTWVPNEPWGWAPFHYGRWGQSASLGWYWIPGSAWGPAWVSWSVAGDYVGWCPLGWGDRPVPVHRGHAVPRGSARGSAPGDNPWIFSRRGELAGRDASRRARELPAAERAGLRVVEGNRPPVDRALRNVEAEGAVPRHVQTRPTPGDTIPELRSDPATTIPFPTARRRYPSEEERRERERSAGASRRWFDRDAGASAAEGAARREEERPAEVKEPAARAPETAWGERRRSVPWSERAAADAERQNERRREAGGETRRAPEARPNDEQRATPRSQGSDRDVVRRLFDSLKERDKGRAGEPSAGGRERETPSAGSRQRGEPRPAAPPPPSAQPERKGSGSGGGESRAVPRRKKDDR